MKTHELKTWPRAYDAMKAEVKTFEFRKNDRDYEVGDRLLLRRYDPAIEEYTGEEMWRTVNYILYGGKFGLPKDFVVMAVTP